jgi:hypothetical protein
MESTKTSLQNLLEKATLQILVQKKKQKVNKIIILPKKQNISNQTHN